MVRAEKFLRKSVAELIAARKANPAERNDLFGRLREAKHPETGAPMSADLLRDSLLTFMMVGHETTAKALTWTYDPSAADLDWLAAGDSLTITYSAQIDDGSGAVGSQDLVITINGANDAPVLDNALADQHATAEDAFSWQVPGTSFSDVDHSDTLTYTATLVGGDPLPGWLAFNAATQTFSGTPANTDQGTLSIRVTASDGTASAHDDFDLVVGPVNHAPVNTVPGDQTVTEDTALPISVSVADVDGDSVTTTSTTARSPSTARAALRSPATAPARWRSPARWRK